ncbi:MAG: 4-hydroxy-tetrahydrodipicolinate reductase [Bacteroidales bacterium]|jgi:4-hydroxy-tetrahydrodipicolinate reductase|nr:4-hydroxy-tetrahydrodipicolinate reductase [Bacteroidales bacterium]
MRILIIGYGKMGKMVKDVAKKRGHTVGFCIDKTEDWQQLNGEFDVAIDFSMPEIVQQNIMRCFELNIPIVVGTTGSWLNELDKLKTYCFENGKSLFYSSNFSLGVFLFNKINVFTAQLLSPHREYKAPTITEIHHIHKVDKPSGTALTLAKSMEQYYQNTEIESVREGEVFGVHQVKYQSDVDFISLKHEAKSREGFALGSLIAAEFLVGRRGVFTMKDLI